MTARTIRVRCFIHRLISPMHQTCIRECSRLMHQWNQPVN